MANAGATAGYGQLSNLYGQGRQDLTQGYGAASDTYQGLMNAYQPGFAAYGDASGANGVQGLQRATDTYHNSGQYGAYGVANDAAQQAIQRAAAAGGMGASGNVINAATNKALDLGNQYWGQYQQGLSPYMSAYGTAGAGLANTQAGLGTALNANDIAQGNAANTTQTTIGNNNAGAEMNNYKVGANQLGALMGVGSLALGGLGGVGGLGSSLGGALTGGFGGSGFALGPTSVGGAPLSGRPVR